MPPPLSSSSSSSRWQPQAPAAVRAPAPAPVPAPRRPAPAVAPAAAVAPSAFAQEVQQFVDMGIDRGQAEAAMQRYGSFDAAFDALINL
jgi:hypothetical protein